MLSHSSQAMDLRSRHRCMLAASPHRVVTTDESKAFRAAGWALFSGFYASAFASGIYFGTTFAQHQKWNDASRGSGRTYYPYEAPASGWSLLVPVMGPLLSVALLPTRTGLDRSWPTYAEKYNWNSASLGSWGLPWMMVDFPGQVAGLVLIILSHRAKERSEYQRRLPNFGFIPYPSRIPTDCRSLARSEVTIRAIVASRRGQMLIVVPLWHRRTARRPIDFLLGSSECHRHDAPGAFLLTPVHSQTTRCSVFPRSVRQNRALFGTTFTMITGCVC